MRFTSGTTSWRSWVYGGPRKDGRFTSEGVSFVYILRATGNLCKIGLSSEPRWRILRHRSNCDVALELICLIRHSKAAALETKLHHYFRGLGRRCPSVDECLKILGVPYEEQWNQYEWFYLTEEDVAWLRGKTTEEVDHA